MIAITQKIMKSPAGTFKESLMQPRYELTEFMRANSPASAAMELKKQDGLGSGHARRMKPSNTKTTLPGFSRCSKQPGNTGKTSISSNAGWRNVCHRAHRFYRHLGTGVCRRGAHYHHLGGGLLWGWNVDELISKTQRYPDRPIPKYVPPKDSRNHDPADF
jgi:hypothetical protein